MSCSYPPQTVNGRLTSYIPLTTTFSSVLLCSNSFQLEGTRLVAFDPNLGVSVIPGVRCQPQEVTTWWEQALIAQNTAFSLGPLICPQSWPTVATSVAGSSTAAMCCPPGYTLDGGSPGEVTGDCISNVPSGTVLTYQSTGANSNSWTPATITLDAASTVGAIAVVGWNIPDFAGCEAQVTSTASSSPSSNQSSIPTLSTPSATSSTVPASATATQNNGLSTGAKTGIGIGAALGAIGIITLIVGICLIMRRRRRSATPPIQSQEVSYHPDASTRLYGHRPAELQNSSIAKPPTPPTYQQATQNYPTELDANPSPQ